MADRATPDNGREEGCFTTSHYGKKVRAVGALVRRRLGFTLGTRYLSRYRCLVFPSGRGSGKSDWTKIQCMMKECIATKKQCNDIQKKNHINSPIALVLPMSLSCCAPVTTHERASAIWQARRSLPRPQRSGHKVINAALVPPPADPVLDADRRTARRGGYFNDAADPLRKPRAVSPALHRRTDGEEAAGRRGTSPERVRRMDGHHAARQLTFVPSMESCGGRRGGDLARDWYRDGRDNCWARCCTGEERGRREGGRKGGRDKDVVEGHRGRITIVWLALLLHRCSQTLR